MMDDNLQNNPEQQEENIPPQGSQGAGGTGVMDTANRALAKALRQSFRLLSFVMIIVVIAFILTGLTQIHPDQCGVRLLFGRIQGGILKEGLGWSAPEPIGRVLKIPIGQRQVSIDDFWIYETPEEATKPLRQHRIPRGGLRPGWDGALLTGDRGLIHLKLICRYSIFSGPEGPDTTAVMNFIHNISKLEIDPRTGELKMDDADEVVRSTVCEAAIRAAAVRTVESIYPTGQKDFAQAVQEIAQRRLNEIKSGLRIERIEVPATTVPLAAIAAFDAVSTASAERDRLINQAKGKRNNILSEAAGGSWKELVGDPDRPGSVGLLTLYAQVRERHDKIQAEKYLREIYRILVSDKTGGKAAEIINEARAYSATIRQRVAARADRFRQLVDKFNATPELMLQRLWANVKQEILSQPTNEKFYLTPAQKTILRINQDPNVRRKILESIYKAKKEKQKSESGK